MRTRSIIAKNTASLMIGEVVNKLISFLFNIYIARFLGVTIYGEYNLVNAFIAVFSFMPDLGTNLIVIREIAKNKKSQAALTGQAVIVNAAFSFLAFILIISLFGPYAQGKMSLSAVAFAAATLLVTSLRTVAIFQFDANEKMRLSAFFSIVNNVFSVSGALIGFSLTRDLSGLFAGVLIAALASTLIAWLTAISLYRLPLIAVDLKKIFNLLKLGLPLGIAGFAALAYSHVGTLLLGLFLPQASVGWYSAANVLVFAAIQLVNVPLMTAVYPTLSRIHRQKKQFKKVIATVLAIIIAWSVLAVAAVQFLAPWAIAVLYGQNFSPAVPVLRLLILIVPFISLSAFMYKLLIIINKQTQYLKISLTGALLNFIISLTLIPQFGLLGAAYAAVFTHLALFIVYSLTLKKHLY